MSKKKRIAAAMLLISLAAAFILAWLGVSELQDRKAGSDYYADMMSEMQSIMLTATPVPTATLPAGTATPVPTATLPTGTATPVPTATLPTGTATPVPTETPVPAPASALDFAAITQKIPDIRGWLVIPDTNVNYPIVQGKDNDFYLDHLPDGTPNRSGSIMLDMENAPDWSDTVSILHGHRMRTGAMFGSLSKFGEAKYAAAHSEMLLYTPQGDYRVQLIAACTVDGVKLGYPISFEDDADFEGFLRKLTTRSAYQADVTPTREDRLILLSTCAYTFDNARFVVLGLLTPTQP